ncbi:TIGR00269 family protein [Methanoculleus sp. 10]|uniref:TIGR00269 family protein n=1 Tax=Methanoculleus sp. 10 TaxID=430615 RepID=UPI0025F4538B|nr:TIGR00269 family protein [Methanoculleus sp. 10]
MPGENLCSLCREPAVVRLVEPERRLCAAHFIDDVEARVLAAMTRERMVSPGDRVAVGLSGGKDSTALLLLLHRFLPALNASLVAVTVDEGIAGYREGTSAAARDLTSELGVEHSIVTFADLFGDDLDRLLVGREAQGCTVCGVLRRRALAEAVKQVGVTKLATGHNLDDEAQSALMNVLRGDLSRLLQDTSTGQPGHFIPRIKPLAVLSEKEIVTYLLLRGYFRDLPECPYASTALRSEVRTMLAGLEHRHPGTMLRLMQFREGVRQSARSAEPKGSPGSCRICGELSTGEVCQACRLLERDKSPRSSAGGRR